MRNLFQENKNAFLLLLGLLFLLLIIVFIFLYQPVSKELKSLESNAVMLESDIATLKVATENASEEDSEEEVERLKLTNKLPMDIELENIITSLEEMEYISNSRFDHINFTYDGSVPERTMEADEEAEGEETDATEEPAESEGTEESSEDNDDTVEEPESVINMDEKPEQLQVVTISMYVVSPDYEHFQTFLNEVENQKRMMTISSIDFEQPGEFELNFVENPDESIEADVTITTFYYE